MNYSDALCKLKYLRKYLPEDIDKIFINDEVDHLIKSIRFEGRLYSC